MRRARLALALVWSACAAGGALASDPAAEARALLVEQQVPDLARSLAELGRQLAAAEAGAAGEAGAALRAGSARAFDANGIFDAILAAVSARWNAERAAAFRRFYATPAGARILAAEARVREERGELEALLGRPERPAAPEPRRSLAERVDRATGSSELYAQALASVQRRLRAATGGVEPARADEEAARARLRADAIDAALFTYRELSDADLASYASFLEGPDARWYFGEVNRAALAAMDAAAAGLVRVEQGPSR